MHKIQQSFLSSLRELKNVHCIALTALFIALSVTLDLLNIRIWITPELRITFNFVLSASIGMLFGPVVAMMAGFCTDIIGYLANPAGGGFFFGFTLTAMLTGLLYGLFFYKCRISKLRILLAKAAESILCTMGLNTIWLSMMSGKAVFVLLPLRALKSLILFPLEVVLLYLVTTIVLRIYRRTTPLHH